MSHKILVLNPGSTSTKAAAKRMQYPDLSLTALCGCFEPPVSKSGLSHRMKKLEALAETLRQNLEQEAKA